MMHTARLLQPVTLILWIVMFVALSATSVLHAQSLDLSTDLSFGAHWPSHDNIAWHEERGSDYIKAYNGATADSLQGNTYKMTFGNIPDITIGTPFIVSDLEYYNDIVWSNSYATDLAINFALDMSSPVGDATFNTAFNFQFEITPNSTGNPERDADILHILNYQSQDTFFLGGNQYKVTLLGFSAGESPSQIVDRFRLPENATANSHLWANIEALGNDSKLDIVRKGATFEQDERITEIEFGRKFKNTVIAEPIDIRKQGKHKAIYTLSLDPGLTTSEPSGEFASIGEGGQTLEYRENQYLTIMPTESGSGDPKKPTTIDVLGNREWTATLKNLSGTSDGFGGGSEDPDDVVDVTATIVDARQVQATEVQFGRVMKDKPSAYRSTTLYSDTATLHDYVWVDNGTPEGSWELVDIQVAQTHDKFTDVTINNLSLPAELDGITLLTSDADPNGIPDTFQFTDQVTLAQATAAGLTRSLQLRKQTVTGPRSGAVVLDKGSEVLGEGLEQETVKSVTIPWSATVVDNRKIDDVQVSFGRVMRGQTLGLAPAAVSLVSTSGDHDHFTDLRLHGGASRQLANADVTLTVAPTTTTFTGQSGQTAAATLTPHFASSGSVSGSLTIGTSGTGNKVYIQGEGLTSEVVNTTTIQYSAAVVDNRQLAATPIAFGKVIAGGPVLAGSTQITTAGNDDAFTRVTLKQGSYTDGQATLSVAGDHLFNSASATASAAATGQFTTAGSRSGSITLSSASGALVGEGLSGEVVQPVNVAWSASVYDRGKASFARSAQTSLSLDFGTLGAGESSTQSFSIWNLIQTMDFTAGLKFNGISASTGHTSMFNLSMPAVGTSLAAGGHTSGGATFIPTGSGGSNYAASYTLSFIDDLTGIAGSAATQSLTLNLTGALGQTEPQPDPPYIINPSFEDVRPNATSDVILTLPDGGSTRGVSYTRTNTNAARWVSAWFSATGNELDSNAGLINPTDGMFDADEPVPDGQHIAYVTGAAGVRDALEQKAFGTLADGWEYVLQYDVGFGNGTAFANPVVDVLVRSGNDFIEIEPISADTALPDEGEWETWTQNYLLPIDSPYAGLPVYIRIGVEGSASAVAYFDNIYFGFPPDDPPPVLLGDFDDNGIVASGDLALVLSYWGVAVNDGQSPDGLMEWVNTEGVTGPLISSDELALVLANWGNTAAINNALANIIAVTGLSQAQVTGMVPEPSTLMALIVVVCFPRHRRGRR
jgi:hypothetical protein